MRIAMNGREADLSTELVKSSRLVDEPIIVELINSHQDVCAACADHASCTKNPFCDKIQVKERSIPLYPTGQKEYYSEDGETKSRDIMREGEVFGSSRRIKVVDGTPVTAADYTGYQVTLGEGNQIMLEPRRKFEEGTKIIEITEADLYPAGVENSFLQEKFYELYPKHDKSVEKATRNARKLYEIYQQLLNNGKVAIKSGFVWKAGTYESHAIIIKPVACEGGKWLLIMSTTKATLSWNHPQDVPPQEEAPSSKAPVVNNMAAITGFLSKVRAAQPAPTPQVQVQQPCQQ